MLHLMDMEVYCKQEFDQQWVRTGCIHPNRARPGKPLTQSSDVGDSSSPCSPSPRWCDEESSESPWLNRRAREKNILMFFLHQLGVSKMKFKCILVKLVALENRMGIRHLMQGDLDGPKES